MWMVNINGGWQPADNDMVVVEWIRQRAAGPQTPIRHSSWPNPMPLCQVPAFQHLFAAPASDGRVAGARPAVNGAVPMLLTLGGMLLAFLFLFIGGAVWQGLGIFAMLLGSAAVATVLVARIAKSSPSLVKRAERALARRPLRHAGWSAVLILGGGSGIWAHRGAISECKQRVDFFTSLKVNETLPFAEAMKRLADLKAKAEQGTKTCGSVAMAKEAGTLRAFVAEIDKQIAAGKETGRLEAAKQQTAVETATAAERERRATETFPARSAEITATLAKASVKAGSGKWLDADADITSAQQALAEFAGTTVEGSKAWTQLSAKIADQRKRIAPQIARIREKQQAEEAKDQAEAAARGPEPLQSSWDGNVLAVKFYLEQALNDPGSYQHEACTKPRAEGVFWVVECSYRAKNGFNATVKEAKRFYIQRGGIAGNGQVVRAEAI